MLVITEFKYKFIRAITIALINCPTMTESSVYESNPCIGSIPCFNETIPVVTLDQFRAVGHVLLSSAGIPLNLVIAIVIMAFKRLHKPRIIIWLGVTCCNLLALITILIEFLAYQTQNTTMCLVFIAVTGVAYTCLLLNLFLALIDRYAAIVYPMWHRRKVTVRRVIIGQLFSFFVVIVIIKFPFIVQSVPLRCGVCSVHGKIIIISNLVLFLMCILAQAAVYHHTRLYIKNHRGVELSVSFVQVSRRRQEVVTGTLNSCESELHGQSEEAVDINRKNNQRTAGDVLMKSLRGKTRRMEVEATWSLLAGVFSLLLFTFPTLLIGSINWGCHKIYGQDKCSRTDIMTFQARELLLGHLVYNPIIYMIRSREFVSTIREKLRVSK